VACRVSGLGAEPVARTALTAAAATRKIPAAAPAMMRVLREKRGLRGAGEKCILSRCHVNEFF